MLDQSNITIGVVKDYLVNQGINPSYQRLKIFEHLAKTMSHPTVDMIYNVLSKEIPTLSKTTIYNTMNLFLQKGLVVGLTIEDNEVRYDSNTSPHAHFKCNECGKVYDIPLESQLNQNNTVCDHIVNERHIYLKGTCKKCSSPSG